MLLDYLQGARDIFSTPAESRVAATSASLPKISGFTPGKQLLPGVIGPNSLILKSHGPFYLDVLNFPKNEWFKLLQEKRISMLVTGWFPPKLEPVVLLLTFVKKLV